jgi:myo-inositol-1-phosphate synthase
LISKPLLIIIAGAQGAVGSTVAAAVAAMNRDPGTVLPWLTTVRLFGQSYANPGMRLCGWDARVRPFAEALAFHRVVSPGAVSMEEAALKSMTILDAPSPDLPLAGQVERLKADICAFRDMHPGTSPVLVNLLPACRAPDLEGCHSLDGLSAKAFPDFPDLAYALAAVSSGVPVVNFTSNALEAPVVVQEALKTGVPLCGRDGKTGQTYLKVVLASALKARGLKVDGWYSLNILGNEDGRNLSDPERASGKIANKTGLLEEILGYRVGERYGADTHKVVIDYYPPRGDSKEAWDVIDFTGLFGLPMSLRVNLQGRDSILAAPMVIDLACWMAALNAAGRSGLVPELGFYFKKPVGPDHPVSFQDQLAGLDRLESFYRQRLGT